MIHSVYIEHKHPTLYMDMDTFVAVFTGPERPTAGCQAGHHPVYLLPDVRVRCLLHQQIFMK